MARIKFEDGTTVEVEGTPTPEQIEEIAANIGAESKPAAPVETPQSDEGTIADKARSGIGVIESEGKKILKKILPKTIVGAVPAIGTQVQEGEERVPLDPANARAEIKEPYDDWGDMFIEDRIKDFNAFKDSLTAGLHRADVGIGQTADRVLEYFGLDDPVRKEQMEKAKAKSEALDTALIPTRAAHPDSTWLGDATSDLFVTAPAAMVGGPYSQEQRVCWPAGNQHSKRSLI